MAVGDSFKTGPQALPAGGQAAQASVGQKGEVLVAATRATYYDLNYNGKVFHGTTAVAGAVLNYAATLGTTSVIVLNNPANSGINAILLKAWWQYVSGTIGGLTGLMWAYCLAASTGGTLGTTTGGKFVGGNKCNVYSAATSFSATAQPLRVSGINLGEFAGGAGNIQPPVVEIIDGDIIAPPNTTVGLVAIGAGTGASSDKSILGLSWAEEPI
jgi:hypothetical protein